MTGKLTFAEFAAKLTHDQLAECLAPPPIINEAALQKAYEVGEIESEEEKRKIRWAILIYETEKLRRTDKH